MRSYGQYCPISRASEILSERWNPLILRNVLLGCTTFNAIADGVPGMSRSLLSQRLGELERSGVLVSTRKPSGRGSTYEPTEMGRALWNVLVAMGDWAERYIELQPEHRDPSFVLWAWCHVHLVKKRLPERRVTVRFDFPDQRAPHHRFWILFQHTTAELCHAHPGYEEDVTVWARSRAFVEWHLGRRTWNRAVADGNIRVEGPAALRRALPTWNAGAA